MSGFIDIIKDLGPFLIAGILFIILIPAFIAHIIYVYFYNPKIVFWDWDKIKDADDDSLTWGKRVRRDIYLRTLNYDEKAKKKSIILLISFGAICELFTLSWLVICILFYFINNSFS